jgi:hypothetical protein
MVGDVVRFGQVEYVLAEATSSRPLKREIARFSGTSGLFLPIVSGVLPIR